MTENTGSHKGFFQKIHIPTLVICLGCVLTASFGHRGWGDAGVQGMGVP